MLRKRTVFFGLLVAAALSFGAAGYALTPLSFASSSGNGTAGQDYQQQVQFDDQGRPVVSQQLSVGGPTMPILADGEGRTLGHAMSDDTGMPYKYNFFDARLKRIVPVDIEGKVTYGEVAVGVYFKSDDCTGTPYGGNFPSNLRLHKTLSLTPGKPGYYIVKDSDLKTYRFLTHSYIGTNGCVPTPNNAYAGDLRVLTPVSISFKDPIPMPIHFK